MSYLDLISKLVVGFIGLEHLYILKLEMFDWGTPATNKKFGIRDAEFAKKASGLAANQGLYNGFLAAGLLWSLAHPNTDFARQLALFFSGCVGVAGLYGGLTVNKRILYIQTVPALISLALLFFK
eukprot:TRINITY_DN28279_c0_g1_i1.p1 TRINITY_DN28279_c0_g1~~TRINITY_DN28279_c0_g1_i1.p1  ORF type:complete len:125 (+),score=48.30 TRINITY_DN28279_c0_g1_i1:133-507(+)